VTLNGVIATEPLTKSTADLLHREYWRTDWNPSDSTRHPSPAGWGSATMFIDGGMRDDIAVGVGDGIAAAPGRACRCRRILDAMVEDDDPAVDDLREVRRVGRNATAAPRTWATTPVPAANAPRPWSAAPAPAPSRAARSHSHRVEDRRPGIERPIAAGCVFDIDGAVEQRRPSADTSTGVSSRVWFSE